MEIDEHLKYTLYVKSFPGEISFAYTVGLAYSSTLAPGPESQWYRAGLPTTSYRRNISVTERLYDPVIRPYIKSAYA